MNHQQILNFLATAEKLKSILRHNWTTTGRQESSAEHSWQMALFFILLNDLSELKVDPIKTLKMIIIHDLVEINYGDVPGFWKDTKPDEHNQLKQLEAHGAKKLFDQLPSPLNHEYYQLWEEFEEGKSSEAKLAQALDKIETILQHINSGPQYWSRDERGKHMLNYADPAVERLADPDVTKLWQLIQEKVKKIDH